jgi:hypothetical protein
VLRDHFVSVVLKATADFGRRNIVVRVRLDGGAGSQAFLTTRLRRLRYTCFPDGWAFFFRSSDRTEI